MYNIFKSIFKSQNFMLSVLKLHGLALVKAVLVTKLSDPFLLNMSQLFIKITTFVLCRCIKTGYLKSKF